MNDRRVIVVIASPVQTTVALKTIDTRFLFTGQLKRAKTAQT
jgi:hypothetical protein